MNVRGKAQRRFRNVECGMDVGAAESGARAVSKGYNGARIAVLTLVEEGEGLLELCES